MFHDTFMIHSHYGQTYPGGGGMSEPPGLSRMGGLRERCGSGVGMGTGAPFRDKSPRLSRKGVSAEQMSAEQMSLKQ